MAPHEVLYSVDCCSSQIALIVLSNEDDENDAQEVSSCGVNPMLVAAKEMDHESAIIQNEVENDADAPTDATREAWKRLRASSAVLGQVLDEKTGFSSFWCGLIQPTLQTTTSTLKQLDKEHQLLKTTAESLTRGTEYITQTLSNSVDEEEYCDESRGEHHPQEAPETVCVTEPTPFDELVDEEHLENEGEAISRSVEALPRPLSPIPEDNVAGTDEVDPTCSLTESPSQDDDNNELSREMRKEKVASKRQQLLREQAQYVPSCSRNLEQRRGMNV